MSAPRSRREQLGAELEHLRRLAGRSGRALAGLLSISQSTISRVESGKALLPLGDPVDAVPWSNFVIYEGDEPFVSVELVHRPETVTDPHQVDLYRRIYAQMWRRAAVGPDAVALIQRIAGDLRAHNAPTR